MTADAGDELRALRARVADLEAAARRRPDPEDPGAEAAVLRTTTVAIYPTAAVSTYGVRKVRPGGDQSEGATVTLTPYGPTFYAKNLGTAVPPAGTDHLGTLKDGQWLFRFDG